ncbi:MAG TPA: hypothetical protein PLN30_03870 [Ferruginibacter sp.]|nr:hypothetical protein [Ferruginibacter sp.]
MRKKASKQVMSNRNDILNELNTLSPLVAGIPFVNVFTVPEGYFNQLAKAIFMNTAEAEQIEMPVTGNVPQGYFDGLAGNIMDKIKSLEAAAKEEIQGLSPVLASIGNSNIFSVPDKYFENSAMAIAQKTGVNAEMELLSAPVAAIGNKNPFTVPDGYFNTLSHSINAALPKEARLVKMQSRFWAVRYAAAAVLVGLLGLFLFFYFDKKETSLTDNNVLADAGKIIKNNSFDAEFATLDAEDIEKYLSKSGEDVQAALVANSALENAENLPDASDYFLDDKTLDKFLNSHNLNSN